MFCFCCRLEIETEDNEISIFISSFVHLQEKSVLSRRVQGLIQGLWPNPVGFVFPKKGNWLDSLGVADCSSLLGTPRSVTLYISDLEVTTQIINLVDRILLEEIRKNDYKFTIVDCMDLEKGTVNIIEEGSVPVTQVMDVLHTVITREENYISAANSVRL
ncbi:hypothetical protein AB205_0019160 [Aquarana catesbeiana]|uniref:Uncharacterized protein n=1 Tax=Aquarana catesbeiana TaxID=8400 RepID=A0A2G9S9R0_AQUCT|nr:hypothetical protein AB205_0019160 [Aquarana catesbeiana]